MQERMVLYMFEKIKEINSIGVIDGYVEEDYPASMRIEDSKYIAKESEDKFGIVNSDDTELVPFEYDSITPLTFGLWEIRKREKVGALQLKLNADESLYVSWQLPCKYDYISANGEGILEASRNYDGRGDITDIIIPNLGLTIEDAFCDYISPNFCNIGRQHKCTGPRKYILNTQDGSLFKLRENDVLLGKKCVDNDTYYLIYGDFSDETSKIVKITRDGSIKKTRQYDDDPVVIYAPSGLDEPEPVGFVARFHGKYYILDKDLNESEEQFEEVTVLTRYNGKIFGERPVRGILADYKTGKVRKLEA